MENNNVSEPATSVENKEILILLWHYDVNTKFCLPEFPQEAEPVALVGGDTVYRFDHETKKWLFNLVLTNVYHDCLANPAFDLTRTPVNPVAGIDFSSKPREEWSTGNWIAHVGGGIRSDQCVVFGSVMAVDAMVTQIIQTYNKSKLALADTGDLRLKLEGGSIEQRTMAAVGILGSIEGIEVMPVGVFKSEVDKNNAGDGISFAKTLAFLSEYFADRQLPFDIAENTRKDVE